jgi:steroid delta-isomerase-like uncharacterized protein
MDTDANKALVRRFVAEVFEGLRPEAVDELVADDFMSHTLNSSGDSKASLRATTERMATLLEGVHFTVEDVIAEGDRVAVRLTAGATARGEFMGLPAAGKSYEVGEIHIFRISGGKFAEHWHQYDAAGIMRQLSGGD